MTLHRTDRLRPTMPWLAAILFLIGLSLGAAGLGAAELGEVESGEVGPTESDSGESRSGERLALPVEFTELIEPDRLAAVESLGRKLRFEGCDEVAATSLLAAAGDESYRVRGSAIRGLSLCAETPVGQRIASLFVEMVRNPDEREDVRSTLLSALGDLGLAEPAAVDLLSEIALDGGDRVLAGRAVVALGRIGEASDRVLEAILEHLVAGPRSPRVTALVALRGLGEGLRRRDKATIQRAITAVSDLLPASDIDVNQQAALFLAEMAPHAEAAAAKLIETFEARRFCRPQVAHALGAIGAPAAAAVPLLKQALEGADEIEKATFLAVLEKLTPRPPAPEATPGTEPEPRKILEDPNS